MGLAATNKRKLIDIKLTVFETLEEEARRQQVSLKRLIEKMLESAAAEIDQQYASAAQNPRIRRIIGSAKPQGKRLEEMEDERLQYLLSK